MRDDGEQEATPLAIIIIEYVDTNKVNDKR